LSPARSSFPADENYTIVQNSRITVLTTSLLHFQVNLMISFRIIVAPPPVFYSPYNRVNPQNIVEVEYLNTKYMPVHDYVKGIF